MRRYVFGVVFIALSAVRPAAAADPVAPADAFDALARGPVHEAFAEPANTQCEQPEVVTKQPPDAIVESPPDQRPAGEGVQWLPGYWAWDADESDFIWVSGCWRLPPPSRRWMPGHWQEVENGWVWVAGL